MGFVIPPEKPSGPDAARALIARKEAIEAELEAHLATLRAQNVTMRTPLVDPDGFPRADIDIYAVRTARGAIAALRNDLAAAMADIAAALEHVYDPAAAPSMPPPAPDAPPPQPFARVDGVAPGSPAAAAGLQRGDLVVQFGPHAALRALAPLAELVAASENRVLAVRIVRAGEPRVLRLTPRSGWGGRGMLGCHIVPYSPA